MDTHTLKNLGNTLDGWTFIKKNDPRILDGFYIEGFTSELYVQQKEGEEYSMGVFYLNNKEVYRAWGIRKDPLCSYHAMVTAFGHTPPIAGCPNVRVAQNAKERATLVLTALDETFTYPIRLKSKGQLFLVHGLTCENCVAKTTELLKRDQSIEAVTISLESGTLSVFSEQKFTAEMLNALLSGTKYTVSSFSLHRAATKSLTRFAPLASVFALVALFTFGHQWYYGFHLHAFMQYFMAGYFLIFGALKVANWKGFVASYRAYDALAKRSRVYAYVYPALEVTLGLVYYFGFASDFVHTFVLVLMLQKAWSVYTKIREGVSVQCACLGGFFNIPITRVTLAEDLLMAAMALYMLFAM